MPKRRREKALLREIKGLTGCPEGLVEVRCLNSVMVAIFFSTVMKAFSSKMPRFTNRGIGNFECSLAGNLLGGNS